MNELYRKWPSYRNRPLCDEPLQPWHLANRKRIPCLMQQMRTAAYIQSLEPVSQGRGTSSFPTGLRGLTIEPPNHVSASNLCYLPMTKGLMYLTVIRDLCSRLAWSWRVSNKLDTEAWLEALDEALALYGAPDISNTVQGAQNNFEVFSTGLNARDITISMDGKGQWADNLFVERLWHSMTYEDVYLRANDYPTALRHRFRDYFKLNTTDRRHTALKGLALEEGKGQTGKKDI